MLQYAAIFFVIALVAALFGFGCIAAGATEIALFRIGCIAAGATEIAKILFFVFLLVTVVTLIMGLVRRKS